MFEIFLTLVACHFIGDFPFQSEFLALNKGKSWEVNFYHAAIYTSTFLLFAKISVWFAFLLFVSHFVIDPLKSRFGFIKHIWMDQVLHLVIILIGLRFFYQ